MGNPWDFVLDNDGDDAPHQIYYHVGRSLSSWEYIEGVLGRLFGAILGLGGFNTIVAERAFGTVSNSKGRSIMLEEAANTAFTTKVGNDVADQLKTDLMAFIGLTKNFAPRRNDIAHGAVVEFLEGFSQKGNFLCPAAYNTSKHKTLNHLETSYRYNSKTIARFGDEFDKLHEKGLHLLIRTYPVFGHTE
jgi:hypothetical protein